MTRLQFIKMEIVKIVFDETMTEYEKAEFVDEIMKINGATDQEKEQIRQDAQEFVARV